MTSPVDLTGDKHGEAMGTRRYQIQQKLFAFGDTFQIKDESDRHVFSVRSKVLTLGDKLVLEDTDGK